MRGEEAAIIAVVFGIPAGVVIACTFFGSVTKVFCHWRDVALKMKLAERGFSSHEIETIVLAGRDGKKHHNNAPIPSPIPRKPPVNEMMHS